MLRHPTFLPTLIGSDAQCEAFLSEQNVAAVCRVNGNDGIILRELADISLLRIHVAFRMQASYPVVGVAENFQHLAADTGHNRHIKYDIDGIRYLNTDFGERRTDRSHGIRDDIHGSAFIGAAGDIIELRVHFLWVTPVVGRTGVLFFP